MDKNSLIKNSIDDYKKAKSKEKVQGQNIKNIINFMSDKKNKDSLSFIKTFLYTNENNDSSNDTNTKKVIKVNTDNYSKSKNKFIISRNINNIQKMKIKQKENELKNDDNISITEKITKFESRIGNLLNIIDNFEKQLFIFILMLFLFSSFFL